MAQTAVACAGGSVYLHYPEALLIGEAADAEGGSPVAPGGKEKKAMNVLTMVSLYGQTSWITEGKR
jgi:hypothetical protein